MCCSPWGSKELDTTQRLSNNNEYMFNYIGKCQTVYKATMPFCGTIREWEFPSGSGILVVLRGMS